MKITAIINTIKTLLQLYPEIKTIIVEILKAIHPDEIKEAINKVPD